METEYSKRVYQGVRVKHTVKDLLAEKRSRQTNVPRYNGGTSPSQPSFVQMPGSHMLPGYYGMRRPFMSDSEFCHPGKQFSPEVYASSLGSKTLPADPSSVAGYSSLIDSYYPESFGDYRNTAFPSGGGPLFPPSALSSLLPPFSGDSHFILRDSWDQPAADNVSPGEGLCADGLASVQTPSSASGADSGSPSPYRGAGRGPGLSSTQNYFHPLEEVHYPSPYASAPSYACSPYMTLSSELPSKMPALSGEESDNAPPALSDPTPWQKDDGASTWSPYEIRRTY
ncbi:POU class 2 homeobox associating-factor 2-like [Conger conger]|uniref:POU class 2 homeobox associating-factor 2-like n=1 Tax=Conger conger TaxID=82655 RepID=UPI002A5AB124|nr:POU class 2 homeobox associating-factor 2-like [Conger conger]